MYKYIGIVVFTIICSLSFVVYLQTNKISSLNKEVVVLDIKVKESDLMREKVEEGVESQQIVNKILKIVNVDIKKQLNVIKQHDLEKIEIKKPKMLERRVNNATDKIWNDIACYSDESRVCVE